jgi:hypothetical protein
MLALSVTELLHLFWKYETELAWLDTALTVQKKMLFLYRISPRSYKCELSNYE